MPEFDFCFESFFLPRKKQCVGFKSVRQMKAFKKKEGSPEAEKPPVGLHEQQNQHSAHCNSTTYSGMTSDCESKYSLMSSSHESGIMATRIQRNRESRTRQRETKLRPILRKVSSFRENSPPRSGYGIRRSASYCVKTCQSPSGDAQFSQMTDKNTGSYAEKGTITQITHPIKGLSRSDRPWTQRPQCHSQSRDFQKKIQMFESKTNETYQKFPHGPGHPVGRNVGKRPLNNQSANGFQLIPRQKPLVSHRGMTSRSRSVPRLSIFNGESEPAKLSLASRSLSIEEMAGSRSQSRTRPAPRLKRTHSAPKLPLWMPFGNAQTLTKDTFNRFW